MSNEQCDNLSYTTLEKSKELIKRKAKRIASTAAVIG